MENYIENIELINNYINKSLSENEIKDFENRLNTDEFFKAVYESQIVFLEGLKRQSLKGEIANAKQAYVRNKWFKFLGISFGVLVVSVFVYFNVFNSDKEYLKDKLNFESEYIQNFKVKVDSIIEIVGKKGTIIKFNPNDLETGSNKLFSGDSLNIELIELVNKQDLLLANAQTISDGKWLVSGGAFKIDITANGETLVLKEGKTIDVQFPKNTSETDMQIFYGERDNGGNINWVESNVKLKQNPFVIFINEGFVVDSVLSKRHGVDWFKGVGIIDTIGFMSFTDLKKNFPKINLYNKDADTIKVLKKRVRIIDYYYDDDGERDDLVNTFRVESIDELYNKKDIIIDYTLIDLEEYVGSELREIYGKVCKQITKQELELEDVISKADYEKRRLSYDNTIKEIPIYNKVSNDFYESVKLSKLGWINVDKFALNEEKINVKFNFNVKTNHNEIYVIDKRNNTVLNVYNNQIDLPINRSFYIIAIGIKGKDVYGFKKSVRFSKKGNLKVDYKQVNESQIRGLLTID